MHWFYAERDPIITLGTEKLEPTKTYYMTINNITQSYFSNYITLKHLDSKAKQINLASYPTG